MSAVSRTTVKNNASRIVSSWIAQPCGRTIGAGRMTPSIPQIASVKEDTAVRHFSIVPPPSSSLSPSSPSTRSRTAASPPSAPNRWTIAGKTKLYSTTTPHPSSTPPKPTPDEHQSPPAAAAAAERGGFFSSLPNPFSSSPPSSSSPSANSPAPDPRYAQQFQSMAESPTWTLADVSNQLRENIDSLSGWKSYVPGVSTKGRIEAIQAEKGLVDAAIAILSESEGEEGGGGGVGLEGLKGMSRKDRLRICLEAKATQSSVSGLVDSFESMTILHRVLRYRVEQGKALPVDEEEAKAMMQTDIRDVLTVRERKEMQKRMQRKNARGGRR